jgi:RNA polymerase sigma-70 factor (ECF subfamily)
MSSNETTAGCETVLTAMPGEPASLDEERDAAQSALHRDIECVLPNLRRYARSLTHDAVDADDLLQECLARALGKLHLWKVGTDLRAWLFSILHNEYVSQIRRAARQGTDVDWSEYESTLTCAPGQIEHLEIRDLVRALRSLPEQQRTAVLMIGLTSDYYEAASACKVPVGTIRSRLSRGRRALRELTGVVPSPQRIAAVCQSTGKIRAGAKFPNLPRAYPS